MLVEMALAGPGIVFAPDFTVRELLAKRRLVDALPGWRLQIA